MPRKACKHMDERLSSSSAASWTGRSWRPCAASSPSARSATRSSGATTTAASKPSQIDPRPYRHANQLPFQIETLIVRLKQDKPAWGAPKIRERLRRLYPDVHCSAISTVHAVLDHHGLVQGRRRRRNRATGTTLSSQ